MSDRAPVVARWTAMTVAAVGLLLSVYLTVEHYTGSKTLACPEGATVNCAKVTESSWSIVGPIPVALAGAVFFAAAVVVCSPWSWRRLPSWGWVRVAFGYAACAGALYLLWVELFQVHAICLWCTGVHVTALALLVTVLWAESYAKEPVRA